MPIDWKSQESYQRLLAALVAASDNSVRSMGSLSKYPH